MQLWHRCIRINKILVMFLKTETLENRVIISYSMMPHSVMCHYSLVLLVQHDFAYGTTMTEAKYASEGHIHKRHPISHPHGWAMGCLCEDFVKIDHVIMAPHCIMHRFHCSNSCRSYTRVTKHTPYLPFKGTQWGIYYESLGQKFTMI